MAKILVQDILPNQDVKTALVVREKQLRVARSGSQFLTLKLVDRTGEITGRVWERASEICDSISVRGVVAVTGRSEQFRDELQLQISNIVPLPSDRVDPTDFLPVCPESIDLLFDRLKELSASLKSRTLHRLMAHFWGDAEIMERFKLAPAAKSMHHAYLGGLLEHTVSVASLVARLCELYPGLDRDLLVVGAFLHDIGKIDEFVYDLCIDYSTSGRLLGHMVLGLEILESKIRKLKGFPREEALMLKHLILSHHGEYQFGAVKLPMTREAMMLHFADDLDAKMNSVGRILSNPRDGDSSWTSYQPLFERFFFKGFPESSCRDNLPPADQRIETGLQLTLWQQGKNDSEA